MSPRRWTPGGSCRRQAPRKRRSRRSWSSCGRLDSFGSSPWSASLEGSFSLPFSFRVLSIDADAFPSLFLLALASARTSCLSDLLRYRRTSRFRLHLLSPQVHQALDACDAHPDEVELSGKPTSSWNSTLGRHVSLPFPLLPFSSSRPSRLWEPSVTLPPPLLFLYASLAFQGHPRHSHYFEGIYQLKNSDLVWMKHADSLLNVSLYLFSLFLFEILTPFLLLFPLLSAASPIGDSQALGAGVPLLAASFVLFDELEAHYQYVSENVYSSAVSGAADKALAILHKYGEKAQNGRLSQIAISSSSHLLLSLSSRLFSSIRSVELQILTSFLPSLFLHSAAPLSRSRVPQGRW